MLIKSPQIFRPILRQREKLSECAVGSFVVVITRELTAYDGELNLCGSFLVVSLDFHQVTGVLIACELCFDSLLY